ncbi:MAG: FG-GAP-like repeat-containing protein, partial [Steroidobacteraceae bacterium]
MATTRTREALVAFVIAACFVEPGLGAVGKTQGIANVSDSGSAQYTIPIWTPPDTGGMQPRLALTYDHRSSNKLLGIGWNISGLSEIRRCSRTWAQDLQARNVRNDSQDRFCLDGRKLRLFAGTYGANGAEYRTEIESFSRVRSYDASPTIGPGYFVVERNDGLKYEYGGTADSRIESVGQNVARAWALNKISDRYGNATLFTYSEDATNGAYRISSIQYTSNPDRSLSPAHVVNFSYEGKPPGEIDIGYVANSQIRELNRLTRIEVLAGATLLRRYQLTYEITLSNTGRSLLKSLQECAGPSSSLDCLAETKFTYQAGGIGLGSQTNTAAAIPSDQFPFAIDVNGDGRDDLIYASGANCTGTWMVMMATTSGGFGSPTPTGGPSAAGCFGAIPIDYNADGKVDLLVPVNGTTWWYMLGGASGLASPIDTGIPASPSGAGVNAAAIDINGDGLEDLVWMDLFAVAIRYRTRDPSGTGTFSSTVTDLWGPMGSGWMLNSNLVQPTGQYSRRRLPDFNGDGKGDLAFANSFSWWDPESQQTMVDSFWDFRFTGGGGAQEPFGPTMQFPRFLDANGDGKDDLLYISNGSLILRFGTGTAFASGAFLGSGSGFNVNQLVVLDSDGDGRDDFIVPHTSGTWYLFRSTGVGATSSNTGIPVSSGWVGATAGDFNSDGLTDVGYVSGGTWVYRMHEGPYPDLLTTATDGFDNACTFEYKPLTAADYTKLATAGFPQQDYAGSLYVVTKYTESNGIGGTYDLESFHYEGARRDLQGRGFLGFAYRSWIDDRDGTAQRR